MYGLLVDSRKFPVFHICAQEIAEHLAEVFMPRVGEETARSGQHAHEAAQKPHVREGVDLAHHTVQCISWMGALWGLVVTVIGIAGLPARWSVQAADYRTSA